MVEKDKINQILVEKVENGYLVIEQLNKGNNSLFGSSSVGGRKFHIANDSDNVTKIVLNLLNKLCTASETKQLLNRVDDEDDDDDN